MIKIKSFYKNQNGSVEYGWHQVTRERALQFIKSMLVHIVTMDDQQKRNYINNERLQGIKVEDVL